jgi:8-oxo-dGTP diphosphatase
VLGREPVKDTFRRRMLPFLAETGAVARGTVGKPARLFRHR